MTLCYQNTSQDWWKMLFTESPDLEGRIGLIGIVKHEIMHLAGKKKQQMRFLKYFLFTSSRNIEIEERNWRSLDRRFKTYLYFSFFFYSRFNPIYNIHDSLWLGVSKNEISLPLLREVVLSGSFPCPQVLEDLKQERIGMKVRYILVLSSRMWRGMRVWGINSDDSGFRRLYE